MMKITLPDQVSYILKTLEEAGYEAYAVGGCVRDSILGRTPEDWDITTSANPLETKALFRRTIDTGLQHGTVTVMLGGEGYEVTTYRIDGEYEDNRHPKEVIFTASLVEDLRRRDFTINAMAYSDREGLVDVFEGQIDLQKHRIRCVGQARERFGEDALRMLRAVRFSAQLGFSIEEETKEAVRILADTLAKISAERIQTEMTKLLISPHPEYLRIAWELGITKVILPEFDLMMKTLTEGGSCLGEETLTALTLVPAEKVLRLTMLLHHMGISQSSSEGSAETARNILHRWRFDNDTLRKVTRLVQYQNLHTKEEAASVRRAVYQVGEDLFLMLLQVQMADLLAKGGADLEEKREHLLKIQQIYREILEREECLSLKNLAVTGKDLIADGMKPGKELGEILNKLLDYVLESPEKNTTEELMEYSRALRS